MTICDFIVVASGPFEAEGIRNKKIKWQDQILLEKIKKILKRESENKRRRNFSLAFFSREEKTSKLFRKLGTKRFDSLWLLLNSQALCRILTTFLVQTNFFC